jgi:predicted ATP-dependent endonuclease of OLD family
MQEVFVRKLNDIVQEFSKTLNNGQPWPVQFVVSTHSSHIANEAPFDSIRYFMARKKKYNETTIKDLHLEFNEVDSKEDRDFIHKYLTLTRCDLFFADKTILFEGPTERVLLPEFIKRIDRAKAVNLSNQYISSLEIGGAYAHHFYKFLDFLELKSVVITDIDSTKKDDGDRKYRKCPVNKGTHTSNAGLKKWFAENEDEIVLSDIMEKGDEKKIDGYRRIAFQVSEQGTSACGRSFEDAFILANKKQFEIDEKFDIETEEAAFSKAEDIANSSKMNFALDIGLFKENWSVPKYIEEALLWLAEN